MKSFLGIILLILLVFVTFSSLADAVAYYDYYSPTEAPPTRFATTETAGSYVAGIFREIGAVIWVTVFVICAAFAGASYHLAAVKGYNPVPYCIFSFFFTMIGLICAAGLPRKDPAIKKEA